MPPLIFQISQENISRPSRVVILFYLFTPLYLFIPLYLWCNISFTWPGNYQSQKRHIQTTLATGSRKKGRARFQPYNVKETWTRGFCVLSYRNQRKVPTASSKQELREAGLGQKTIVFKNKRGNFRHLQEELFSNYPRLTDDLYRQGCGKELIYIKPLSVVTLFHI